MDRAQCNSFHGAIDSNRSKLFAICVVRLQCTNARPLFLCTVFHSSPFMWGGGGGLKTPTHLSCLSRYSMAYVQRMIMMIESVVFAMKMPMPPSASACHAPVDGSLNEIFEEMDYYIISMRRYAREKDLRAWQKNCCLSWNILFKSQKPKKTAFGEFALQETFSRLTLNMIAR